MNFLLMNIKIFTFMRINLYIMRWFIPIKNYKRKSVHVQVARSVQKGRIKYTVAPKEAYRPKFKF